MHDTDRLVNGGTRRYGRLAARPERVNPLDEFRGAGRLFRRLRLKEWIGFSLTHPDWACSMILQDAHYLASSEIYAGGPGTLHQHAANAAGGSLRLPQALPGSRPGLSKPGYRLQYAFSDVPASGRHRIEIDIAATASAPAFTGELELDAAGASAPLSVSHRMPGGKLYTHKALFPVSGTLRVGDAEIVFDPSRDLAILDEHKSLLPYRTRWLWGTFAAPAAGGPAGANFGARPALPGEEEESGLWVPGACEPLADVTFTRQAGDPLAGWTVTSADGRLDATFTPQGRKDVRHQLGLFEIDYYQLFGTYRGIMRSLDGTAYPVEDAHGVLESMRARL